MSDTDTPILVYGCTPIRCCVPAQYRHAKVFLEAVLKHYLKPSGRKVVITDGGDYMFDVAGNWEGWFGNCEVSGTARISYYSDRFLYSLDEGGTFIPPERVEAFKASVAATIKRMRLLPCSGDELAKILRWDAAEDKYLNSIGHKQATAVMEAN